MTAASFTWPYPKNTDQLIHVIMVSAAAIMLSLWFFAHITHSYQTRILDEQRIQEAAETLTSNAKQADLIASYALSHKTTQSYQEAMLYNLGRQTQETADFLRSHEADANHHIPKNILINEASRIRNSMISISSRPSADVLHKDRSVLQDSVYALERLQ